MQQHLSIGFIGDYSLCKYFSNCNITIDESIVNELKNNDRNIVNFESPFTDNTPIKKNGLQQNDERCFSLLNSCGIDICSLANNHLGDCGEVGIVDTISSMKLHKMDYLGAGITYSEASKPLIIEKEDIKVGILSVSHSDGIVSSESNDSIGILADNDKIKISELISGLKKQVNWCVVIYHGGDEFLSAPSPAIRDKYISFLEAGADIVVAHHPHVVQGYEYVGEKCIFYSLGNFVFDTPYQRSSNKTDIGCIISFHFYNNYWEFTSFFTHIDRDTKNIRQLKQCNYFSCIDSSKVLIEYEKEIYNRNKEVFDIEIHSRLGLIKCVIKLFIDPSARKRYFSVLKGVFNNF